MDLGNVKKFFFPFGHSDLDDMRSFDWMLVNNIIPFDKYKSTTRIREEVVGDDSYNVSKRYVFNRLKHLEELGVIEKEGQGYTVNKYAVEYRDVNLFLLVFCSICAFISGFMGLWFALFVSLSVIIVTRLAYFIY